MKSILTCAAIFIFAFGCKFSNTINSLSSNKQDNGKVFSEEKGNTTGVIIEIPKLAKLSPDEITNELGTPKSESKPDSRESYRTFDINQGEAEFTVRFQETKILDFELRVRNLRATSDEMLFSGGFEIKDKPDWENAILKSYKNRLFNGVRFNEIEVVMSPPKQKWETLRVRVNER